jgi:hypothetical protein
MRSSAVLTTLSVREDVTDAAFRNVSPLGKTGIPDIESNSVTDVIAAHLSPLPR